MTKKKKYLTPSYELKAEIIKSYIPKIKAIINKLDLSQNDYEDLISSGIIGLLEALNKYDPSYQAYFSQYVERYILKEIAEFLRMKKGLPKLNTPLTIDELKAFGEIEPTKPLTSLPSNRVNYTRELEEKVLNKLELEEMLSTLTPLELNIIMYYYGLNGYPEKTLREIGIILNMPHTTVAQKLKRALRKCTSLVKKRELEDFIMEQNAR